MILPKQKLEAYGSRQAFGHNDSLLQCYPQPIVIIDALSGETTSSRRAPKRSLFPLSPTRRFHYSRAGDSGGHLFVREFLWGIVMTNRAALPSPPASAAASRPPKSPALLFGFQCPRRFLWQILAPHIRPSQSKEQVEIV